ncbi:MAG: NTP transferase domain-containing protein, partial [Pirellula sp.]
MQVIMIAAGRGSRLMPTTADAPKCYAEVQGKSLLEWALDAFRANGLNDICFVGGYLIDRVRQDYPQFDYRHNVDWPNNNILASLMYAEDLMNEPFICCYSDILFTPAVVEALVTSPADCALGVDTDWLKRYESRLQHPSDDAEKVTVQNGVVTRIHRNIPEHAAYGEFVGAAKFSAAGAARLRAHYHGRRSEFQGKPWREAKLFEKAYLIHLIQDMIEAGYQPAHVDT